MLGASDIFAKDDLACIEPLKGCTRFDGWQAARPWWDFLFRRWLANVPADDKVAQEETFGPLAPLFGFEREEEAIRLTNDTEFGLASYFYSRDIGRIWRVAEGIESGMVGINTGMVSTEVAPFGGVKQRAAHSTKQPTARPIPHLQLATWDRPGPDSTLDLFRSRTVLPW